MTLTSEEYGFVIMVLSTACANGREIIQVLDNLSSFDS